MSIFGFGKKKEEEKKTPCCCCGTEETEVTSEAGCCDSSDTDNTCCGKAVDGICCIKVLGAGCKSCHDQYQNVINAVAEMNIATNVEYITDMEKVAFICVHNSCRSQIAEALGKHLASDVFESYSAGTETKPQINQDAVRLMKKLYNIDMEQIQYSKTFDKIPTPDITISMGCDVGCPYIGREFDDNWGLPDPTGQSDEEFERIISLIKNKVIELKSEIQGCSK